MIHRPFSVSAGLLACLAAVAILGCGASDRIVSPAERPPGHYEVVVPGNPLLVQQVTLDPAEPAPGDTLRIRSVVRNTGQVSRRVTGRVCGLTLRGSLVLVRPGVRCQAISSSVVLAAGDSVVQQDDGIVMSQLGTYELRVQHLLDPDVTLSLTVQVRWR